MCKPYLAEGVFFAKIDFPSSTSSIFPSWYCRDLEDLRVDNSQLSIPSVSSIFVKEKVIGLQNENKGSDKKNLLAFQKAIIKAHPKVNPSKLR